jgi:prepilin-type N-terminal cleavage/methylation domain-containing protein
MIRRKRQYKVSSDSRSLSTHCRQRGFSIIELMIALVLVAVGASLALPSYVDMIEKRHVTRGAEQLLAFVNSAQLESVKWNQVLNVSYTRVGDSEWCVGANLGATVCDCTVTATNDAQFCGINGNAWKFDDDLAGDRVLVKAMSGDDGGDNAYTFEPNRGMFVNMDDSFQVEMHSSSSKYQLQIMVTQTGQAVLCSKNAAHAVNGYSVCPVTVTEEEAEVSS